MPRLTKSLPSYRHHRASGQAIVTLGGVDHYLGPHGSQTSLREYDRLIAEWLAAGRQRRSTRRTTVAEVMAAYWTHCKSHYRNPNGEPTTEVASIRCALRRVDRLYRQQPAEEFGPLALKAIRQQMIDDGLARGTINSNVGRIKRMFRWAASEQLIDVSVSQAVDTVAGLQRGRSDARETKPIGPIDAAAVEATLAFLPEVVADMVRLQRLTGMRPAEVCLIRPLDVDRSGEVWSYRPESHKTQHHGHERVVFLGPRAQEILLRYLARDAEARCFRPCDSEAKRRALLCATKGGTLTAGDTRPKKPKRPAGEAYTTNSYRRAIHRACDRAGVPRWSPNRLRHAVATEVRARFGLEAAQVMLGHAAADVTQVYAERDLAKGVKVASLIG